MERLEREVMLEFDLVKDTALSLEQTRMAVHYIVAKLFGQKVNRYFTDNQVKTLFKEFDFDDSARIEMFELMQIARRIAVYAQNRQPESLQDQLTAMQQDILAKFGLAADAVLSFRQILAPVRYMLSHLELQRNTLTRPYLDELSIKKCFAELADDTGHLQPSQLSLLAKRIA